MSEFEDGHVRDGDALRDLVLLRGEAVTLRFDRTVRIVWWGPVEDTDRVAVGDGRVRTWPSIEACSTEAQDSGWRGLEDGDDAPVGRSDLDFHPAQGWLDDDRTSLDIDAALNLWNFAGDVAASVGIRWDHRGEDADRCYEKLVAGNVPYLFNLESFVPIWDDEEIGTLRRVLGEALEVLRTALRFEPV